VILVKLDSAAIQRREGKKETLPGTSCRDKYSRKHYFHTIICNSLRFVIVIVIIIVDIIVVDIIIIIIIVVVVVIIIIVVVVIVIIVLLLLHISSPLMPSYCACRASGTADT
jgi:hypothetical protein